jgi:hypothetical protein
MSDNIIQFPKTKSAKLTKQQQIEAMLLARNHYDDTAHNAIRAMIDSLIASGYHPFKDKVMMQDISVLLNLVVAMLYRVDGELHFLHEPMDEIHEVIKYIKELKQNDELNLFTDDD